MTDRELLKLAAKAAGLHIAYWTEDSSGDVPVAVLTDGDYWQPLLLNTHTDCMGDALRLSVMLSIDLCHRPGESGVGATPSPCVYLREDNPAFGGLGANYGGDPMKATREVIVQCAAEIGKAMD